MEQVGQINEALKTLLGQPVQVWSNTGDDSVSDDGVLEAYDFPWIRIRKPRGELLCFSIYNVRLIKFNERNRRGDTNAETLLRAAGTPDQ